jgi:phospholipid/cholesterol/gamma-HCH transport system permease protein
MGHGARLLCACWLDGAGAAAPAPDRDQIHFLGNYSLAIIGVSGLFVGFVLGLQGYYILQRYGSAEALGMMVALPCCASWGRWSRPCCSRPCRHGPDGRNRPDEGRRAAVCHGDDGGRPRQTHSGARLGRLITMPLLAAVFSAVGVLGGWLVGVVMIGIDSGAFWGQMQQRGWWRIWAMACSRAWCSASP